MRKLIIIYSFSAKRILLAVRKMHYLPVFDGHSGERASEFCEHNLLRKMTQSSNLVKDPCKALKEGINFEKCNVLYIVY